MQFSNQEKAEIRAKVQSNGGIISGYLFCNQTTHLIVATASGEKFTHAKNAGIHIVSRDWLDRSIEAGYPLLESDFTVTDGSGPSSSVQIAMNRLKYPDFVPKSQNRDDVSPPKRAKSSDQPTRSDRQSQTSSNSQNTQTTQQLTARLNEIFNEARNMEGLFDGFSFYICGFPDSVILVIRKLHWDL